MGSAPGLQRRHHPHNARRTLWVESLAFEYVAPRPSRALVTAG